jgi:protein-disulfide isomerase
MTKFYWVLGAVAVIGVAAVGYSVGSNSFGAAATEPVVVEGLDDPTQLMSLAQGIVKGDPDAPITIVEFADYSCPGCGQFALQIKPQVVLQYVETGKAKFVYYDFPLISIHPHSFLAARAARCANDVGKFWEYQDQLFRNQPSWTVKPNVESDMVDFAVAAGLDEGGFEACLKSDAFADVVSANLRLAEELGINSTPTIMMSRGKGMARRLMNYDFASIAAVIEDMVAEIEAEAAVPPTGN